MRKVKSLGWLLALSLLPAGCKKEPPKKLVVTGPASAIEFNGGEIQQNPKLESKPDSPSCMCDPDALKQAVLDRIWESGIGHAIYKTQQNPERPSRENLSVAQQQIDRLVHYRDQLKDHCLQDAYSNWVDFYQGQHDDATRALEHSEEIKPDTDAKRKRKQKAREVAECKRKGIVPKIPAGVL